MKGWVYVITNKAMPGLVKVGYSTKDPDSRAAELNHTGSPHPYVVEYEMLIDNPRGIEQRTHRLLSSHREGKEWFRCSTEDAIAAIQQTAGKTALTETFKRADREKAVILRAKQESDKKLSAEVESRFVAEEAAVREKYERMTNTLFPVFSYGWYWVGVFIASCVVIALVFEKITDGGIFVGGVISALILTQFVQEHFTKRRERSTEYLALQAERDAAIAAVRFFVVPCPKCNKQLRFPRATMLLKRYSVDFHCPACQTDFTPPGA